MDKYHPKKRVGAKLDPSNPIFPPTNQFSTDVKGIINRISNNNSITDIQYGNDRKRRKMFRSRIWLKEILHMSLVFHLSHFELFQKLTKYEAITGHK